MDVTRVRTVEEHEEATVSIRQTAVQLYNEPVRLSADEVVIVNPDAVPRQETVGDDGGLRSKRVS